MTTSVADDFGTLRSLLQDASSERWRRLCGLLDRHERSWREPHMQERILPYVESMLDRWPQDLPRYAQHSWLHYTMSGFAPPQLQLATALHLIGHELIPNGILKRRKIAEVFWSRWR